MSTRLIATVVDGDLDEVSSESHDEEQALGWRVMRGWIYRVVASDSSAWDNSTEYELEDGSTHVEAGRFGFHGGDLPPCSAEYLADENDTYLVISGESDAEEIETVDGFSLEPVTLDEGHHYNDGAWQFRVLQVDRDGQTTVCGRC